MSSQISVCPASLSFIFQSIPHKNLVHAGSIGMGCTVDKNVQVLAQKNTSQEIYFNKRKIRFPTLITAMKMIGLKNTRLEISSMLPLGYGFGISASATLASLDAVNKLFKLGLSTQKLIIIAHKSEIIEHTGLGSVATQITGGFLVKTKPGIPTRFISFPFCDKFLYAIIIDKLETPTVLTDNQKVKTINKVAREILGNILANKDKLTLSDALDKSLEFAIKSEILTDKEMLNIIKLLKKDGVSCSVNMLGKVIITDRQPKLKLSYPIQKLKITDINHSIRL
jgi:pantoate kinase